MTGMVKFIRVTRSFLIGSSLKSLTNKPIKKAVLCSNSGKIITAISEPFSKESSSVGGVAVVGSIVLTETR